MVQRNFFGLTVACGVVAAMLAMPAQSQGACRLWDCLFGAAPSAQTTYAPAYVPVPADTAPACASPLATPCAPQTRQYATYMPDDSYSPVATTAYSPVVATAYQPAVGVYPLTTYRPFLGTYQTRLVPYTTYYQSYYAPPAVSYAYSPVVSYAPACNSCGSCGGCSPCGSCETGACGGVTYQVPASGCSSCRASTVADATAGGPVQRFAAVDV